MSLHNPAKTKIPDIAEQDVKYLCENKTSSTSDSSLPTEHSSWGYNTFIIPKYIMFGRYLQSYSQILKKQPFELLNAFLQSSNQLQQLAVGLAQFLVLAMVQV